MKKEDKDIEIHFENGHVPRRQVIIWVILM